MKFHSLLWFIVVAALHSNMANASVLVTSAPALDVGKVANGLVNTTSAAATLHSLRSGLAFAHWQSGKSVNAITVPECAVIVKLVNSTRQISDCSGKMSGAARLLAGLFPDGLL